MGMSLGQLQGRGNRGIWLEQLVTMSHGVVEFDRIPNGAKAIGGGKIVRTKSPVDFIGTVIGTGRGVYFDCKESALKYRVALSEDHLPTHQRDLLIRHGRAGAIAGLLVRASHESQRRLYWLNWRLLLVRVPSILFMDPRMIGIGPDNSPVEFQRIITALESGRGV